MVVHNDLEDGVAQELMSTWNFYLRHLFAPTESGRSPGWNNRQSDFLGIASLRGYPGGDWDDSGAIGVCYQLFRGRPSRLVESDVILSPHIRWTLDDQAVLDRATASQPYRHTANHEISHAIGLDHEFAEVALSNYHTWWGRAGSLPYLDDVAGARRLYPELVERRRDLAPVLFVANGEQRLSEVGFPRELRGGETFSVDNVRLENRGSEFVASPEIAWALVRDRDPEAEGYSLGVTAHPSLDAEEAWEGSIQLTLPRGVPAGEYYLAARVDDESPVVRFWPGSNNVAYSRLALRVRSR
jgi:hypothetical protein